MQRAATCFIDPMEQSHVRKCTTEGLLHHHNILLAKCAGRVAERFIKLLSMYIAVADCANASCDQVHIAPPFCIHNTFSCVFVLHAQLRLFPLAAVCIGIADAAYLRFASFCERAGERQR